MQLAPHRRISAWRPGVVRALIAPLTLAVTESFRMPVETKLVHLWRFDERRVIQQLPVFADLDDAALKRLSRALKARCVNAGDVVIRKDVAPKSVFFIASGAVESETAGQICGWGAGRWAS